MNPDEFMATAAAAVALRALFEAYVAAGFTSDQAMQFCLKLIETANAPRVTA